MNSQESTTPTDEDQSSSGWFRRPVMTTLNQQQQYAVVERLKNRDQGLVATSPNPYLRKQLKNVPTGNGRLFAQGEQNLVLMHALLMRFMALSCGESILPCSAVTLFLNLAATYEKWDDHANRVMDTLSQIVKSLTTSCDRCLSTSKDLDLASTLSDLSSRMSKAKHVLTVITNGCVNPPNPNDENALTLLQAWIADVTPMMRKAQQLFTDALTTYHRVDYDINCAAVAACIADLCS